MSNSIWQFTQESLDLAAKWLFGCGLISLAFYAFNFIFKYISLGCVWIFQKAFNAGKELRIDHEAAVESGDSAERSEGTVPQSIRDLNEQPFIDIDKLEDE